MTGQSGGPEWLPRENCLRTGASPLGPLPGEPAADVKGMWPGRRRVQPPSQPVHWSARTWPVHVPVTSATGS